VDVEVLELTKSLFHVNSLSNGLEESCRQELILKTPLPSGRYNYKCAHDNIEAAVYGLLPAGGEQLQKIHMRLGHLLLESPSIKNERMLFDCADQLNRGLEFIDSDSDRLKIAELNLSPRFSHHPSYVEQESNYLGRHLFRNITHWS
jgi:predicted ATPase